MPWVVDEVRRTLPATGLRAPEDIGEADQSEDAVVDPHHFNQEIATPRSFVTPAVMPYISSGSNGAPGGE